MKRLWLTCIFAFAAVVCLAAKNKHDSLNVYNPFNTYRPTAYISVYKIIPSGGLGSATDPAHYIQGFDFSPKDPGVGISLGIPVFKDLGVCADGSFLATPLSEDNYSKIAGAHNYNRLRQSFVNYYNFTFISVGALFTIPVHYFNFDFSFSVGKCSFDIPETGIIVTDSFNAKTNGFYAHTIIDRPAQSYSPFYYSFGFQARFQPLRAFILTFKVANLDMVPFYAGAYDFDTRVPGHYIMSHPLFNPKLFALSFGMGFKFMDKNK